MTTKNRRNKIDKEGFTQRLESALTRAGFPPKNKGRIQLLADLMGLSHRGAGKWLDGQTSPPLKKYPIIAEKLKINAEWLKTGKGNMVSEAPDSTSLPSPVSSKEVPLYTAQDLKNPYRNPSQTISCYAVCVGKTFAFRIDSEAMSPRFPAGSLIIIDTGRQPKDGDFVLVEMPSQPTLQFRQLFMAGEMKYLEAHNPKFDRLVLNSNDRILGVIIQTVLLFR